MTNIEQSPQAKCTIFIERHGGRSEAAAVALERRLKRENGVDDAEASFRIGRVRITYDERQISAEELEELVRNHGVSLRRESDVESGEERMRSELLVESVFVVLTFLGMTIGLLSSWLDVTPPVVWTAYGVAYVFGGWYGLQASIESLRHRSVDIDLLMILAAIGALIVDAPFEGAMLLFLFSLSNVLQHYAIGRSRRAIKSLIRMRPESAQLLKDGEEVTVALDDVSVGELFVVRPGDRLPLDGVVQSGESTVDQSTLTGESVPVVKEPGDEVFGGTINETGSLEVEVTRQAHESAISRLIHMVEDAQSEKAPTQRLIDRVEQPYVLGVFGLTAAAIVFPLLLGTDFSSAFYRAMTLMVAASPCAVIISTPAAVLSAIASGGRQGVLFKGGQHVESAAGITSVAFDKTGTLTEGDTRLTDVIARDGANELGVALDEDALLATAAAVQSRSEHHLAQATVARASEGDLDLPEARHFQAVAGKGVRASVGRDTIHIGNRTYVETVLNEKSVIGLEHGLNRLSSLEADGKTSVVVAREVDDSVEVLGWLAFTDTIREGAATMIADLRRLGVDHIVMLTGDNERVAQSIADEVGIDEVQAELLPEEKVDSVNELIERHGEVAMVGDGVNDAPAIATSTLGVAMGGAGTDVALETADVVLMGDELGKIPYVLSLGRKTRRTLAINLAIAFGAIGIMVATILLRGLPLPLAVVGHEGSTVLVSLNGLRLLGYRQ